VGWLFFIQDEKLYILQKSIIYTPLSNISIISNGLTHTSIKDIANMTNEGTIL
jgi:hypothetical protein